MIKALLSTLLIFLGYSVVYTQPNNWTFLDHGEHLPHVPRDIYFSENLSMSIYCAQFFDESDDPYLAGFDGENWISLADTMSGTLNGAIDFESGFLIYGPLAYVGSELMESIAYFDGTDWFYPWSFDQSISKLVWVNDTLYAIGWFTEIDGEEAYRIARLVDGEWEGVLEPGIFLPNSSLNDLSYYNGEIYVGGGFETLDGIRSFARIEGSGLVQVAEGLSGLNTAVRDMQVYDGELYLGGIIPQFQGNAGNHIVRFNGTDILPVGEPFAREPYVSEIAGNVQQLHRIDDYLYVVGNFYYAGDVSMFSLARWDGQEWCGLFGDSFLQDDEPPYSNAVWGSGTFQDQLMIYIYYLNENDSIAPIWIYTGGDEVENCTQTFSTHRVKAEEKVVDIYPNPSIGLINLESEKPIERLAVFDGLGKLVYQENTQYQTQVQVDLSHLPTGLYLVQAEGEGVVGSKKVVLE